MYRFIYVWELRASHGCINPSKKHKKHGRSKHEERYVHIHLGQQ